MISTFSILKAKGGISDQTEISECLNDPTFQAKPTAVKKFLFILPYIYKRDRDKFKEMLKISGKKRKYFALSSKELEETGSSVSPKQIPGSPVDRGKPSGVFL